MQQAFHCAVEENNIPLCEWLLEKTDINTVNADGKTALFLAIDKFQPDQRIECLETIKFLLERGASLQAGVSGLNALEWVRKHDIEQLPLVFIEHGSLPLRYGPDFANIFQQAAVAANVSVIEKLREARLHPLRRHDSRRLSEIVNADYISDEIADLVTSMEHAALERIWPAGDSYVLFE
jgi:ankyrin repeat protein